MCVAAPLLVRLWRLPAAPRSHLAPPWSALAVLTILYSIILAILAATVAYTALQLRFDILKAKYYHVCSPPRPTLGIG